jgi:hypothetical protein
MVPARRRDIALHLFGLIVIAACLAVSWHFLRLTWASTPNVRSVIGGWSYLAWIGCLCLFCLAMWHGVVTGLHLLCGLWHLARGKEP